MLNPQISTAERLYGTIPQRVGCGNKTDRLSCLRATPIDKLNHIFNTTVAEGYYSLYLGPLVDGDIIARPGFDQMRDGVFVRVPYVSPLHMDLVDSW